MKTHAALKLTVIDQNKGPLAGIVMLFTGPDDKKYYTEETDAKGYAEVLVPNAATYELEYLSLGRKKIAVWGIRPKRCIATKEASQIKEAWQRERSI